MRTDLIFLAFHLLGPVSGPVPEEERPAPPEARVRRARGQIRIDGRLDEDDWKAAAPLALRSAGGKGEAARPTLVRLLHDQKTLYISFHCEDPDIWTAHQGRDAHLWTEDVVEVFIDVDPGDPGYAELEVSPLGDLFDGLFLAHRRQVLMSWNPPIGVAVSIDGTVNRREDRDRSWTVEMAIPVGDLAPSPGVGRPGAEIRTGGAFRINFYRNERSEAGGELQAWAPVEGDFHAPALFGRVVFD